MRLPLGPVQAGPREPAAPGADIVNLDPERAQLNLAAPGHLVPHTAHVRGQPPGDGLPAPVRAQVPSRPRTGRGRSRRRPHRGASTPGPPPPHLGQQPPLQHPVQQRHPCPPGQMVVTGPRLRQRDRLARLTQAAHPGRPPDLGQRLDSRRDLVPTQLVVPVPPLPDDTDHPPVEQLGQMRTGRRRTHRRHPRQLTGRQRPPGQQRGHHRGPRFVRQQCSGGRNRDLIPCRLCDLRHSQILAAQRFDDDRSVARFWAPVWRSKFEGSLGWAKVHDARRRGRRQADVAQLVAHHLAKVRVAGSNPVVRSEAPDITPARLVRGI